jgi:3-hydroxy-9,10-secoandrosta-1,3,5(10)-triene-9,17-dione monooxygenase
VSDVLDRPQAAAGIPSAEEMVARARALISTLAARARDDERNRNISKQTIADLKAAGLFKVLQPKRWGGYEHDIHTYFNVQMALGEGDLSVAWVYGVVGVHPWAMGLMEDQAERDVYGKDDNTLLCSSLMPVGVAKPVDGGFRLSGHWKYASGSTHCDWAFLGGAVEGDPNDRRVFLVPKSDYEIVDTWHVPGLKATGSNDIVAKDAFIPAHRTLKTIDNFRCYGPGQAANTSALYRLPFGQVFFRGVSTGAIGALQAMLDAYIEFGKGRTYRLTGNKASDDPMMHLLCAEATAAIDEMKTILHRDFGVMEGYATRGEVPPLQRRVEYKFHNGVVAERCSQLAARLFKAAGTAGIAAELPFGRIYNDISVARQHISNQYEQAGKSFGAMLFGLQNNKDMVL